MRQIVLVYLVMCSTPFGITDYIGTRVTTADRATCMCSTPFGITDYIGRSSRRPAPRTNGAQRLSASRIISGGAAEVQHARGHGVLNAFRHHGLYRMETVTEPPPGSPLCSTPFGITDYIGRSTVNSAILCPSSAQRLSASRIISGRPRLPAGALARMCSTPFGITDYIGQVRDVHARLDDLVLNAFRHHGLYRPQCVVDVADQRRVLNAFRHHGLYRSAMALLIWSAQVIVCSTPFGITDYIGPAARWRSAGVDHGAQRLSASRIISVRRAAQGRARSPPCAQRLSASRIISERKS